MIERRYLIRDQFIHVKDSREENLPVIVFLHGFTGSTSSWDEVVTALAGRFRMIAIDLIGHGKTSIPDHERRFQMSEQLADLESLFAELNLTSFTMVGYSMGGRIALAYAKEYPQRVRLLILESTSPGLKTAEERAARIAADLQLAKRIEREGIKAFVNFWEEIPLFSSQKKLTSGQRQKVRAERLNQREAGLIGSLKGIGTGSQPSYWPHLEEMTLPILLITGEMDEKFVAISREMKSKFPNATHETVKNVGHAIHVEKPVLFATMVEEHIMKTQGGN